MIFLFTSLGSITLAAALLGLAAVWTVRRPLAAWHGLAIALLITAWFAEHTTLGGRLSLVAAIAVEALAWWALRDLIRSKPPASSSATPAPSSDRARPKRETEPPAPPSLDAAPPNARLEETSDDTPDREDPPPADDDDESDSTPAPRSAAPSDPEPARERAHAMTTFVLLRSARVMAPAAFLASLRRCGRRDATLAGITSNMLDDSDGSGRIKAGDIMLSSRSVASPVDRAQIDEAVARLDRQTPAAKAALEHVAHIAVTTTQRVAASCDDVVRLHHYAHAALTEFAPVVAAFWPEARLLATADELPGLLTQAKDASARMSGTCTQVRSFPLPAPHEDMVLLDSLGLSAFRLPDIQIIAPDPPGDAVTEALAVLVDRFFVSGCEMEDGSTFEMDDRTRWRVSLVRSAFAPDRPVVQLTAERPDSSTSSG